MHMLMYEKLHDCASAKLWLTILHSEQFFWYVTLSWRTAVKNVNGNNIHLEAVLEIFLNESLHNCTKCIYVFHKMFHGHPLATTT